MLPFIEVTHLPSASSFYSAITQPLGLRYISAGDAPGSPSLTYGFAPASIPVFEIRQVAPTARALKLSRVVLSAPSPDVVGHFRAAVQRSKDLDGRATSFFDETKALGYPSDKVVETDLDGNVMEVVYIPPPGYPDGYMGSTVRRTQSNENEVSRILSWNYDVVVSEPMALAPPQPTSSRRYADDNDDKMGPVVRRSVTSTTTLIQPLESSSNSLASPRQNGNGSVSTSTVVGTLLGVAAAGAAIGAGVAYGVMKHDRPRTNEFEAAPPPFQRRSTFPAEPYPRDGSRYSQYGEGPGGEKDYTYGPERRAPTMVSRHSYSKQPSAAPSARTRSEAPGTSSGPKSQLLLTDAEHRSQASSRQSARTADLEDMVAADYRSHASAATRPSKYAPSLSRSQTMDAGAASYVSARSHKTASTVRPALPLRQHTEPSTVLSLRPKTVASRTPTYVSARDGPAPASRAASRISARDLSGGGGSQSMPATPTSHAGTGTRVSARNIALPRSGVGSSQAPWEKEDDLCSIAPSDSISCVGSRRSERLYH